MATIFLAACDKTLVVTENDFTAEGKHPLSFSATDNTSQEWIDVTRANEQKQNPVVVYEQDYESSASPMTLTMTSAPRKDLTYEEVVEKFGTRAAPVTNFASSYGARGFGIFAYAFPATESWNANKHTSEYMHNIAVRYNSTSKEWSPNNVTETGPYMWYFWPGPQYKMRFYAYAPYRGDDGYNGIGSYTNMTISSTAVTGPPTIKYEIPATIRNHFDFCVAKTSDIAGDNNKPQSLKFKHAMTAVQIKVGDNVDADVITSIALIAVWRNGTINLDTQEWTISTATSNISEYYLKESITVTGTAGQILNSGSNTFIMLPRATPASAEIRIVFKNAGSKTFKIGSHNWAAGSLVTYTIEG